MPPVTKFIVNKDTVRVISLDGNRIQDSLPPAVYVLQFNKMTGFYLQKTADFFDVPQRLYGSVLDRASKVMTSYKERPSSTGVLLSGAKGAGKTMLASVVCNQMIVSGKPVVLIESAFTGPEFTQLAESLGDCCLFFDEFGKVYPNKGDDEAQHHLLTLFDGTHSHKRLILLTENSVSQVTDYILNRPGRMYYHFQYQKLEASLIQEYCAEKKVPTEITENIIDRMNSSYEFSFDVLQAIVEEYLRFGGSVEAICSDLNIERPVAYESTYIIKRVVDLKEQKELVVAEDSRELTLQDNDNAYVRYYPDAEHQASKGHYAVELTNKYIIKKREDTILYRYEDLLVELVKKKDPCFNFAQYM